jgi:hypothetical protein
MMSPAQADRFKFSYSLWMGLPALLFVVGHDLDRIFNLWLFLVPVIFIPAIVAAVLWLIGLVRNAVLRRWRRVASIAAAPVIACSFFLLLGKLGIDPERIRFEYGRAYYLEQVGQIPRVGNEPRFKIFNWGSTGGAAVVNVFHTLVFDESGEIALPQQSSEWYLRAGKLCPGTQMCSILQALPPAKAPNHDIAVRKLRDHFYLVTEWYQ